MSKTPFSRKCEILGAFWFLYREDSEKNQDWKDFFFYNDISLPLAYLVSNDIATMDEESNGEYIEETWDMLCEFINVDPEEEYADLIALFDASSQPPLEDEEAEKSEEETVEESEEKTDE